MGISEAIARVRKSAKKANLEGALASVGASLGAGLQSTAIPPRLRPAATRIASLLGAHPEPRRGDLPSLERALDEQLHGQPGAAHAAHPAGEVCPFTGLRADGTLDTEASATPTAVDAREADVEASAPASKPEVEASAPASEPKYEAPVTKAQPVADERAAEASAKSRAASKERSKRSEPAPANPGSRAEQRAPAAREQDREKAAPAEKGKEKLAGERPVAKTSARSASKPAAKQTNGKANQRKK